jgi:hypothetical protein
MSEDAAPERVRISLPDAYKPVDEEVWVDLEAYLYQGFLTSSAHLAGKTFVFKTINHHELRYLSYLKPMRSSPVDVRDAHRAALIASSVFMVDGENLLTDRHRKVVRLSRAVSRMPSALQDSIVQNLAALNEKAARLRPLVEVFVHENRSRYRWMHTAGSPVHSPSNTGVAGTDELGMNYCQQAWTTLNRLLDSRETMERDWVNAKFIGSCFAGKGVRSVDEKDRARAAREKAELEELKMKVLHGYLNRSGAEQKEAEVSLPDGRRATVVGRFRAESAEELRAQMEAAIAQEKDHHDLVVEKHIAKGRERAAFMEESRQKLYRAPALSEGVPISGSSRVLGGREEAEALLARMKDLQAQQMAQYARQVRGDAESSDGPPDGEGLP